MFKTDEKVASIVRNLPENVTLTKEILKLLGNTTTDVKKDENIKNSYYVYLKDTIYLANNKKNNEGVYRLCLIAHECKHSIQSKLLQKMNFIFSNIQILFSVICLVLSLFVKSEVIVYSYIIFSIFTILPRVILETDAVISSTKIANDYLSLNVSKDDKDKVIKLYNRITRPLLPFFVLSFFTSRLILCIILVILYRVI